MTVVLVLIGIMFAMGVTSWMANLNLKSIQATKERQVAIRDALISYMRANGRLPCPDIGPSSMTVGPVVAGVLPDGIENRAGLNGGEPDTTTDCAQAYGYLPYADLGLNRESALDLWGNALLYRVATNTPASTPSSDWVRKANFRSTNIGAIKINDRISTLPAVPPYAAVVISHGKNGAGAWTTRGTQIDATGAGADELVNVAGCIPGLVCFGRDMTESTSAVGGAIDDVVLGISVDDLLGPLIKEGLIKSASAVLTSTVDAMVESFAAQTVKNYVAAAPLATPPTAAYCTYTFPTAGITTTDPWGGQLTCAVTATNQSPFNTLGPFTAAQLTSLPAIKVCTITSKGPDPAPAATADDVPRDVTNVEIAAKLLRSGC